MAQSPARRWAKAIMDEAKIEIDKKKIVMEPVKALGEQHVKLKLHKDINAEILLKVEGSLSMEDNALKG